MNEKVRFNSKRYQAVCWANLLQDCYIKYNNLPTLLVNHQLSILPESLMTATKVLMVSSIHQFESIPTRFNVIENQFLANCQLTLVRIKTQQQITYTRPSAYIHLCFAVYKEVLKKLRCILQYTHDHLSNRFVHGEALSKQQVVMHTFAIIWSECDFLEKCLRLPKTIAHLCTAFDHLLNALQHLAQLAGGRALLRGHVCELIFHVKQFQHLYLKEKWS